VRLVASIRARRNAPASVSYGATCPRTKILAEKPHDVILEAIGYPARMIARIDFEAVRDPIPAIRIVSRPKAFSFILTVSLEFPSALILNQPPTGSAARRSRYSLNTSPFVFRSTVVCLQWRSVERRILMCQIIS
jgi:hypothetical protein